MGTPGLAFLEAFAKMPLLKLPVRTSVVEVTGGRVMFSPGSMMDRQQLTSGGEISDIVVPSLYHTSGGPVAAAVFPGARLWGPPGIRKRLPKHQWKILGEDPWPYQSELHLIPVAGMPAVQEHILYYTRARALLVADLFFNVLDAKGAGAWLIFKMFGTYQRFAVSKFFARSIKDKHAFVDALRQLAKLDLSLVVPAHGAILERDAKASVLAALRERKLGVDLG